MSLPYRVAADSEHAIGGFSEKADSDCAKSKYPDIKPLTMTASAGFREE